MTEEIKEQLGEIIEIDGVIAPYVLCVLYKQSKPISLEEINNLSMSPDKIDRYDIRWMCTKSQGLVRKVKQDHLEDLYQITTDGVDWYKNYLRNMYQMSDHSSFGSYWDKEMGIPKADKLKALNALYTGNEYGILSIDSDVSDYIRESLVLHNYIQNINRGSRTLSELTLMGYKFIEENKPDTKTIWGEQGYLNLLRKILYEGVYRKPENEEGRNELFAEVLKFDLTDYKIPIFTTKQVFIRGFFEELMWFLKGDQDTSYLDEHKVTIWDEWKNAEGIVGPLYGYQWRHWQIDPAVRFLHPDGKTEIDQISEVLDSLRNKPEARSHMVTAWRPDHLKLMSIKPCHILLQFYRIGDVISLALYQRSCDSFLGVPFNVGQYSAMTHMVAHQLGCTAGTFTWIGGDVHIYENHFEQVREQLINPVLDAPTITFNRLPEDLFSYEFSDITINGYKSAGKIPATVSVQGTPGKGIEYNPFIDTGKPFKDLANELVGNTEIGEVEL